MDACKLLAMRLNKYIALSTGLSRRAADEAIAQNRVRVNGIQPTAGQQIGTEDKVALDGSPVAPAASTTTIMLNKPAGYVCSREGQGSRTVYDLLPEELHTLKPVGRLDKDSSGLILLTNDGELAQQLTHPSFRKMKVYQVTLDKVLLPLHQQMITDYGIRLEDGVSKFQLERTRSNDVEWTVMMFEGRNRQIRRTFESLGYNVIKLHRISLGNYKLGNLEQGKYEVIK
jgi:23S rRNA pseudouridine2605 synthase